MLTRLRRLVIGVEPGRPVSSGVLLSARPWVPPLLTLVVLLVFLASLGLLSDSPAVKAIGGWWEGQPASEAVANLPLPLPVLIVLLAGTVVMLSATSWSWAIRLTAFVGAIVFAGQQLGLASTERLEDAVHWLASQPGVDVFDPPPRGSVDAKVVIIFAMALTPFIVGLVLFVLWAWSSFVADFIRPLVFGRLLPDWVLMTLVLVALATGAYLIRDIWSPWCLWVLGVIARAIVIQLGAG